MNDPLRDSCTALLVSLSTGVVVAVLLAVGVRPASAQITCGATITGKVVMTNNLPGCLSDPAVTIAGGGSLDMDGHQISGCVGTGILLTGQGAKLSNGSVNGCGGVGVHLAGTGTHKIDKIAVVGNVGTGLQINSSSNKLASCSVIDNGDHGIAFTGNKNAVKLTSIGGNATFAVTGAGNNNNFTQNVIIGSQIGINIGGDANKLSRNTIVGSQQAMLIAGNGNKLLQNSASGATMLGGINVSGNQNLLGKNVAADNIGVGFALAGQDNKLSTNAASDNSLSGFVLNGSGFNVKGCVANNNGAHGFSVLGGTVNLLKANIAMANVGNGVLVNAGALSGAVAKTVALENGDNDLQDDNANCDANVWSKSVFRTSEAAGVPSHACIE